MASIFITPEAYSVFNPFDEQGLLLDLPRLPEERNPEYKQRLMDVFVNRASSSYRGLINAITRELGLSITEALRIQPVKDVDGNTLLSDPAVTFQDTKCILYDDYSEKSVLLEIDRFEQEGGAWTLSDLRDAINATGYFNVDFMPQADPTQRSMCLFNQSTAGIVPSEDISGAGSRIVLENYNLIPNTVSIISPNLTRRVSTEEAIRQPGDYYIRHEEGIVVCNGAPAPGSIIRYEYHDQNFVSASSPVILHDLQSDDFKTKMFERVPESEALGLPTKLGADLLNELLSVHGSTYGV